MAGERSNDTVQLQLGEMFRKRREMDRRAIRSDALGVSRHSRDLRV